jgi:hypothetical protein
LEQLILKTQPKKSDDDDEDESEALKAVKKRVAKKKVKDGPILPATVLPETKLVKIPQVDNELSDIIKKSEDLDR